MGFNFRTKFPFRKPALSVETLKGRQALLTVSLEEPSNSLDVQKICEKQEAYIFTGQRKEIVKNDASVLV